MARIVYVGLPAHGHINPTLPVMKELIRRGHEVLYCNGEEFREKVAPTGVVSEHYRSLCRQNVRLQKCCRSAAEVYQSLGLSDLIQTAFIERVNLTIRQSVSLLTRKTWSYVMPNTINTLNYI